MKRLCLIAMLAGFAWTASATQVELRMEFTKDEIYEGEHTLCNFVLYAESSGVEVEVAKFPEFRGFWSENLALRQGPLPLSPDFERQGWYRTVIGSYLLTSMVGRKAPEIVPMKLVLKSSNRFVPTDEDERILISYGAPPRILPLPPLQDPMFDKDLFRGAVGSFVLTAQDETIMYQKSEPVLLRVLLQGEGNFREINELPLTLPEGVEILSRNAYAKGAGQYYTKTFEYTLAVHREEDLVLPPVTLIYFHPRLATYQQLQTVPIQLRFEPTPPAAITDDLTPADPLMEGWSSFNPVWRNPLFWIVQVLLVLMWGGKSALRALAAGWARLGKRPAGADHRARLAALKRELAEGRIDTFMRDADQLAEEVLQSKLSRRAQTRMEALRNAPIPETTRRHLLEMFAEHDRFLYSRDKTPPSNPSVHLKSVRELLRSR